MGASARTAQRRTDSGVLSRTDIEALLGELAEWYDAAWRSVDRDGGDQKALFDLIAVQLADGARDVDNMLALAMCALKLECYDAAKDLALKSMAEGAPNPRALCIAGLAELRNANTKSAQALLAQASRLARSRPEYRTELHLAQRLLILAQFR